MVKNPPANAGDVDLIPGSGRSPGGRHGNALQFSCLGNPTDRAAWRATVHRAAKSQTGLATKEQYFFRQLHGDVIHTLYSSPILSVLFFSF